MKAAMKLLEGISKKKPSSAIQHVSSSESLSKVKNKHK